jgi:CubicO group peptidase (beta-lactamase class C family)
MKAVRELMQRGVTDGVFPGGVLLVAKEGRLTFFEAFGLARLSPERPMTTDTVFDLASLTKPLATSVALMRLVQQGKLNLDQTLGKAIPDFSGTDKAEITIRQLLCHASGLPDYRPYYETLIKHPAADRKSILRKLLSGEDLIHEPGEVCLYSDLGFMILQWLIETATEMSLDRFVEESVYGPLGLKHLFFVPLQARPGATPANQAVVLESQFAATEDCPWRGKILDGEVHDDNAYALGGVAGHAGLFGTARDVYGLLKELLNVYDGKPNSGLFRRDVVETFFERQSDTGSWALGFDTPTRPDSSSGRFFSDQSVGHLGFAGTSLWVDLLEGVMVILLTNRIHPYRKNERIKPFRPILHDTVMDSILTRPL